MGIKYHNGSSWQTLGSGNLRYHNGASWEIVKKGYYHNGTGWNEAYVGNDPKTYYFVSNATKAGRGTSWKLASNTGGSAYPQISRYLTSSSSYPWYGVVGFGNDTSGVSLASRLEERPVVKSAKFNVQRWSGSSGFGSGWGNFYIGKYTGGMGDTYPSNLNCDFSHKAYKNYDGLPAGRSGTTVYYNDGYLTRAEYVGGDPSGWPNNFPNNGFELGQHRQGLVNHLAGVGTTNTPRPWCLSHTNVNGTSSRGLGSVNTANYAEQTNYWNFWPAGAQYLGAPLGPTLIVELDYA